MDKKHYLLPRYKVIADWPSMIDFHVGQIITLDKDWANGYKMFCVEDCQGKREYIEEYFRKYPHLFKKLNWNQERPVKEMPEYVKVQLHPDHDWHIIKVSNEGKWDYYGNTAVFLNWNTGGGLYIDYIMPSDEKEYLEFINQ